MTDTAADPFGGAPEAAAERADLDKLINAYADARIARERAEEEAKKLRAVEDAAAGVLFDTMERLSLRSVNHERGRFTLNDLAWAVVEDEEAARVWAEKEMPELLTLQRQRLSVLVREHLKGERDEIPGVSYKFTRGINWRRT